MKALPLVFLLLAALGGCAQELPGHLDDDAVNDPRTENPAGEDARAGGKLDLLFVIDSSGSMREEQQAVLDNIEAFVDSLTYPRSLHIGVITPEIGLGEDYVDAQCNKDGSNDGMLHVTSDVPGCEWATQPFISDSASKPGDYQANYPHETDMTFGQAFSCLADVGTEGCGFEQPIAAANLALDGRNPGFRRPDAALAVIFVSDEDDCSADDFGLFDPGDELGALSSFRCTRFGITCDQDVNSVGDKTGCSADESSPYLRSMEQAAASLASHVGDPSDLFVATLVGPNAAVAVEPYVPPFGEPIETFSLLPSCSSIDGEAVPGVRFASFSDHLSATGATTMAASICQIGGGGFAQVSASLADFMAL